MLRNLFLINERSTALYLKLLMVFSMNITSQCRVYFLFFRNMNVLHVAVVVNTCCIAFLCNKLICVVESENVNICSAFMHCVIGFTCVVYGMPKLMHLRQLAFYVVASNSHNLRLELCFLVCMWNNRIGCYVRRTKERILRADGG